MMIEKRDAHFEWDLEKERQNVAKHNVSFDEAIHAFLDEQRVIAEDIEHSMHELRYYCFGRVEGNVLTVRFTRRSDRIRIIGAGFWRKGRSIYEEAQKNRLH
jgi:uncharacterized DUF497 family protein